MENAAQAYPNVLLDVQTGDLDEGQAIVQNIPPNTYDCIISRGGTADPDIEPALANAKGQRELYLVL